MWWSSPRWRASTPRTSARPSSAPCWKRRPAPTSPPRPRPTARSWTSLDARNLSDLARRVDDLARTRFGLAAGIIALESEGLPPAGWKHLVEGQVDLILDGPRRMARMGFAPTALGLFGPDAGEIRSMAMVRMASWEPSRQGLLAFGSANADDFTPDMGAELVAFLARVVERTAERWPLL